MNKMPCSRLGSLTKAVYVVLTAFYERIDSTYADHTQLLASIGVNDFPFLIVVHSICVRRYT
jgi:hypothetical protein